MKRNIKTGIGLIIAFIIGISTTVGAATIFRSEDITYESDKTEATNVKDSLDELYSKVGTGGECPKGYICTRPISVVEIGDYISMTPTSTSYTIAKASTGYTADQTINPSELNLWRVIKKNDDGTVEMVSEYVSSTSVYFKGKIGYRYLVGTLNEIAAQYTNTKYVQSTRYMGYNGQIEKCTSFSATACPGDEGYVLDRDLVKEVLGTEDARMPDGKLSKYWVAGRLCFKIDYYLYQGVFAGTDEPYTGDGIGRGRFASLVTNTTENTNDLNVRPIITLRSDVFISSGDGKSAGTAYQLA